MTHAANLKMPSWLEKLPAAKKQRARNRFILRIVAAHYSEKASFSKLSAGLGMHANTLSTLAGRNAPFSAELCIAIEKLVGRDVMPREVANPEIFSIPSA